MLLRRLCLLSVFFLLTGTLLANELLSLKKDYENAKAKVGGQPDERVEKVKKNVAPVLEKIGDLDTNDSLAFLLGELKAALPEVAAACARPIMASSNDAAVKLVLLEYPGRPPRVKTAILESLAESKRDLASVEKEVLQAAHSTTEPEVKRILPPVLAKVGTIAAAKWILANVHAPKSGGKGEDPQIGYNSRATAALGGMKSDEVKQWLGAAAFSAAGSDAAKLIVVAKAVGEQGVSEARKELVKQAANPSADVAIAAVNALTKVGLGEDVDELATTLEKRRSKGDMAFRIQILDALASTGNEKALETILRFAGGSDSEMRMVALGSLALFKQNPAALAGLIKGLKDGEESVRAAALRGLVRARDKGMIGPLIEFLGDEKDERLKVNAAELLVRLTEQNMGLVHADWKKWWEANGERFELPKGTGEKGGTRVKAYDLSYFGIEIASQRVSFLVDISSSMQAEMAVTPRTGKEKEEEEEAKGKTGVEKGDGGKRRGEDGGNQTKAKRIEVLKREMVRLLRKLPAEMQINILTFNKTFNQWQPQLQPLAGNGRQRAIQFVEGLSTETGTNVFDTLEAALKDKRVDTIYLLTDGEPSTGRIVDGNSIINEIKAQNRLRGATIHCIGFGEDSPFLKTLAEENGGKYRFVDKY